MYASQRAFTPLTNRLSVSDSGQLHGALHVSDFRKNFCGVSTFIHSQGTRKGVLLMLNHETPHREWEMSNSETYPKLTVGIAVVAAFIVLINLVGIPGPGIWDQLRPDGVAHRLALVRF